MSKRNQDASASVMESVTMDSRKLLSAINNSAQSQIKFFSEAVRRLGEKSGKKWNLSALLNGRLFIEDVNTGQYIMADFARSKGGKVTINNFKKIEVNEGAKNPIFESACKSLIDAIESGNGRDMDASLSRIAANRFRGRAIPNSGMVRTRDGAVRHIDTNNNVLGEGRIQRLAEQIVEAISDRVTINEGKMVGEFVTEPIKLPVSELMNRRVVAYHMRERAKNAYWSNNFQTLVESTAALISNGDDESLKKAVDINAQFLFEHQEFSLLTKAQTKSIIENTLATRGIFNESIAGDTASLFHRVGLKVNRNDIIDSWKKTAEKVQHPVMLENVNLLASASDFPKANDAFLKSIFEAVGETTRMALLNGLKMLKDKLRKGKPAPDQELEQAVPEMDGADDGAIKPDLDGLDGLDDPTADKPNAGLGGGAKAGPSPNALREGVEDPEADIDLLISKLENPDTADDNTVYGAMDLLSQVQSATSAMDSKNLDNFDQEPGMQPEPGLDTLDDPAASDPTLAPPIGGGAPAPTGATTVININTGGGQPQISGTPESTPAPTPDIGTEDAVGDLGALDDIDLETNELDDSQPDEPELDLASVQRTELPLSEDDVKELDSIFEELNEAEIKGDDIDETIDEDPDLFTLPEGVEAGKISADYGVRIIAEYLLPQKIMDLEKLIRDRKVPEDQVDKGIDEMAGATLAGDPTLVNDQKKLMKAKQELIGAYMQKKLAAKRKKVNTGGAVAAIGEDQIKSPCKQLARRGLKKAAINQLVEEGKLNWLKREGDGVLGTFKGIQFVIDHATPPALLSSDGEIEIPIPESLIPGALYLAEVNDTEAEADMFVEWLNDQIEQLKPITEEESRAIDEGVARISVSPDVKVEVDVIDAAPVIDTPPVISEPPVVPTPGKDDGPPAELVDGEGDDKGEEDEEDLDEAIDRVLNPINECDKPCGKCKKKNKDCKCKKD